MLSNILLILGVAVLSLSLRSFNSYFLNRLGTFGILVTSFLAGYLFTGSIIVGLICAFSWLLLPWLELLTRIRQLRLPREKTLRHKTPPSRDLFPSLEPLTDEIETEDFVHVEDVGWEWDNYRQFFRLFYRESDRTQASICMVEQESIAFFYLSISTRTNDGKLLTTWNYPFSYPMKLLPQLTLNRVRSDLAFDEMVMDHKLFLMQLRVGPDAAVEQSPDTMQDQIQKDLRMQIAHNMACGLLAQTDNGDIRYTWRGLFYIWCQFLRDFVRL